MHTTCLSVFSSNLANRKAAGDAFSGVKKLSRCSLSWQGNEKWQLPNLFCRNALHLGICSPWLLQTPLFLVMTGNYWTAKGRQKVAWLNFLLRGNLYFLTFPCRATAWTWSYSRNILVNKGLLGRMVWSWWLTNTMTCLENATWAAVVTACVRDLMGFRWFTLQASKMKFLPSDWFFLIKEFRSSSGLRAQF